MCGMRLIDLVKNINMKNTNAPMALKTIIHRFLEKIPHSERVYYLEAAQQIMPLILPIRYEKSYQIIDWNEENQALVIALVNGMLAQSLKQQQQRLLIKFNSHLKQTHPQLTPLRHFKWEINPHLNLAYQEEKVRTHYTQNPRFIFHDLSEKAQEAIHDLMKMTSNPELKKSLQTILDKAQCPEKK